MKIILSFSTDLPDNRFIPNVCFFWVFSNVRILRGQVQFWNQVSRVVQLGLFKNVPLVNDPVNLNN